MRKDLNALNADASITVKEVDVEPSEKEAESILDSIDLAKTSVDAPELVDSNVDNVSKTAADC